MEHTIILAGATGDLGSRIATHLVKRGATVKALLRKNSPSEKFAKIRETGAFVTEVDFNNVITLTEACKGGTCVVSALSGLRETIVDTQTKLLEATVLAGVPRFIPSDYSIDFTKLPNGSNRNLDLRREFAERLDKAPVKATSILNGMFTDLLKGEAPVILPGPRLVVYWGSADQPMDFTTIENTAEYTALAALDPDTPRYLRIAGEVATIRDLQQAAQEASGKEFHKLKAGGLGMLSFMIKATRKLFPQNNEVFPAWQGMQYLHNMFTGLPKLHPLDNTRYPEMQWTTVKDVIREVVK